MEPEQRAGEVAAGPTALQLSHELSEWLTARTQFLPYKGSHKNFVAGALLYGGLDHFRAICALSEANFHSSAFALLRVQWESLVRGVWIHSVCREEQAPSYWTGEIPIPGLEAAVKAIVGTLPRELRSQHPLSEFKVMFGKLMHGYTHMGANQIQLLSERANNGATKFPQEQVDAMLVTAARIACYTATALSWLEPDQQLESAVKNEFLRFNERLTRLGGVTIPNAAKLDASPKR